MLGVKKPVANPGLPQLISIELYLGHIILAFEIGAQFNWISPAKYATQLPKQIMSTINSLTKKCEIFQFSDKKKMISSSAYDSL